MSKPSSNLKVILSSVVISALVLGIFAVVFLMYLVPSYQITNEQIYSVLIKLFPIIIGLVLIQIGIVVGKRNDDDFQDQIDKLTPNSYDSPLYKAPKDDPMMKGDLDPARFNLEGTANPERIREVVKEVPVETVKEVIKEIPVEVVKEVQVPVEKIVEVEREVPIEVKVPFEVVKEVTVEKEVPVQVTVEVEKEVIKEVPVEVIKEVQVPVEIVKEVVKEVEVPVEVIKEVPVETVREVEVPVEVVREVPVEIVRETVREVEVPVEVIKEVVREVPVEVVKEVVREVPVEVVKEVVREVPVEVFKTVEVPTPNTVEVPEEALKAADPLTRAALSAAVETRVLGLEDVVAEEAKIASELGYDLTVVGMKKTDLVTPEAINEIFREETLTFEEDDKLFVVLPLYNKAEAESALSMVGEIHAAEYKSGSVEKFISNISRQVR